MQAEAKNQDIEPAFIIVLGREFDEEIRHRLLGQVLKRVKAFVEKYDADGDPRVTARAVEWDFAQDTKDHQFLIVLAVRGMEVIGHLLGRAVNYFGKDYVYVQQVEIDEGSGVTLEQERVAFRAVKTWQQQIGAAGIRAVAVSPAHVRLFCMVHGGKEKYTTIAFGEDS